MPRTIWLCALLALPAGARGDTSLAGAQTGGAIECGSARRSRLKRAVAEYCEHDATADARGCHELRRALRDCASDGLRMTPQPRGAVSAELRDPVNASYAWFVELSGAGAELRVDSFSYRYDDCDGG